MSDLINMLKMILHLPIGSQVGVCSIAAIATRVFIP